jgi:hypothetical protein
MDPRMSAAAPARVAPQMPVRPRVETAEFFHSQRKSVVERNRTTQLQRNSLGVLSAPGRFSS